MQKKVLIGIIILTVISGAIIGGYIYSSKIEQDKQVKLERKIRAKKAYQKLEKQAKTAINQAYISRSKADIDRANHSIDKLNKNDKKNLKEKMNRLLELLEIIQKTNNSIEQAKKTKSDEDITIAQQLIDSISEDYLAKDKAQFQTSLDQLTKSISEEKAQAEIARIEAESSALAQQQASYADNQNNYQAQVIQETPAVSSNTDSSVTSGGSYGVIPGTNNGVGWATSPADVPEGAVIQP